MPPPMSEARTFTLKGSDTSPQQCRLAYLVSATARLKRDDTPVPLVTLDAAGRPPIGEGWFAAHGIALKRAAGEPVEVTMICSS